jgi:uncharacterized membrane protein required for colicin V production
MNLVDLGIIVVIGLGVLIGWRNGLIGPLLAETTFLIGYWIFATHPGLVALVPSSVPRPLAPFVVPVVLGLAVGFIGRAAFQMLFRLPLARQVDRLLGAAANGALAFVIAYVVLLGLVSAGTVLDPLARVSSLHPSQIVAMQTLLAANPQAAGMVPTSELSRLAGVAAVRPVPLEQLGHYAKVIDYYEHTLRPQLATSWLAPIVLRYGQRIPLIGRAVRLPKLAT